MTDSERQTVVRRPFTVGITPMLRLGVTGPVEVDESALRKAAEEIIGVVSSRVTHLAVVSCLAAGTDQTVAKTALDRGHEVWGVVPSRFESYSLRMPEKARPYFTSIFDQAHAVLELDLPLPDGQDPGPAAERQRAYEEANIVMLEHTDLLIAAICPPDKLKPGGAAQTVVRALTLSIPVVLIEVGQVPLRWGILEGSDPLEFRKAAIEAECGELLETEALHVKQANELDAVAARVFDQSRHGT